jgi:hypothetical protein
MDPTATLLRALRAIKDQDRDEAREAFQDLIEWLARGGFMPSPAELETLCAEFAPTSTNGWPIRRLPEEVRERILPHR